MPCDRLFAPDENLTGTARVQRYELDGRFTGGTPVRTADMVLTALALVTSEWTGRRQVFLDLEHHGRDVLADELDVARTIGWFTVVYPLVLSIANPAPETAVDYRTVAESVTRQLRRVEPSGAAHGIVRHLLPDSPSAAALRGLPGPQLLFNYLGRVDDEPADSVIRPVARSVGMERHPHGQRAYVLEVNAHITGGHLCVDVTYHPAFHDVSTIAYLGERLKVHVKRLSHAFTDHSRPPQTAQ